VTDVGNGGGVPRRWTIETLRVHTAGQLAMLRGDMIALRREIAAAAEANAAARQAVITHVNTRVADIEGTLQRIENGLDEVTVRMTAAESRDRGASALWAHIVAGVGLAFAILATFLAYSNSQAEPPLPPAGVIVVGTGYAPRDAPLDVPRILPSGASLDLVNAPSPP
jgi:hypothetical protein